MSFCLRNKNHAKDDKISKDSHKWFRISQNDHKNYSNPTKKRAKKIVVTKKISLKRKKNIERKQTEVK